MREAYAEAKSGNLEINGAVDRLNEIADTPQKYEAIELCFEVMAADGVVDENEIKIIKSIAEGLDLDSDEIERLRDAHLINLNISTGKQASIETILHMDPGWSKNAIKNHLRTEFAKWNNRLNTLGHGKERENAQNMLDAISQARRKYV